jgi:hypothetical protein
MYTLSTAITFHMVMFVGLNQYLVKTLYYKLFISKACYLRSNPTETQIERNLYRVGNAIYAQIERILPLRRDYF